jgi:hypothetical protein
MTTPTAVRDLPPLPVYQEYSTDLSRLVEAVNGFIYQGDRLNAIVETVRVLRANPDLAARLLACGVTPNPRS